MLHDFGAVTVIDLTVSLLGVMLVLPAAIVWAEERLAHPARASATRTLTGLWPPRVPGIRRGRA
jgi:hypothetical protein